MVAILEELHADRVDLVGNASIPILYTRNDDGEGMMVQGITLG